MRVFNEVRQLRAMSERQKRAIVRPHFDPARRLVSARPPISPLEERYRAFTHMHSVYTELLPDVYAAAADVSRQTGRRTYARALFALIEAVNHSQHATTQARPGLDPEIRERVRLAPAITWRKARGQGAPECTLLRSTVGCAAAFATYFGCPSPIRMTDTPWDDLARALDIRVRIKAPSGHEECLVSDEELALLRIAHRWYVRVTEELIRCTGEVLRRRSSPRS